MWGASGEPQHRKQKVADYPPTNPCTWRKVPTPKRVLIDTQLVLGRLTHLSMHVLPPLKWQGVRSNLNLCLSLAPLTTNHYYLPLTGGKHTLK